MIELIQSLYEVSEEDMLTSRCRKPEFCEARQLHWLLLKRRRKMSLSCIGRMYKRSHATIIDGINHIEALIEVDRKTRDFYQKVTAELEA